jgi:hypothetical protein
MWRPKHRNERTIPERARDTVTIGRDEWENLKTDLRTAKLLNVLTVEKIGAEEERHTQQAQRFADVIDTLDARVGTLIRSVSAMMSRIDDDRARIGVLEERGLKDHAALLMLKSNLDIARARISVLSAIAYEATGEHVDGGVLSSEKYQAKIGDTPEHLAAAAECEEMLHPPRAPTLSEIIAAAGEPDVQKMREYYAGKEAERIEREQQAEAAEATVVRPSIAGADAAAAPEGPEAVSMPPPSGGFNNGEERVQP